MHPHVQTLESRRLFAGLPSDLFAQASDTYTLTIGTNVPTTPLTSIQWSVTAGGAPQFQVVLPSGPSSVALFQMTMSEQLQALIRVEQLTAGGTVRQRWDMSNDAKVLSYAQFFSDGVLYDGISFEFRRMINTFFVPNPPGSPIASILDYNVFQGTATTPALASTRYMSTSPEFPATIEFGQGQLPLTSYGFSTSPSDGPFLSFSSVSGADTVPLIARVLNGTSFANVVYTQRAAGNARPLLRTRFTDVIGMNFGFSDVVGDSSPAQDGFNYAMQRVQTISYSYAGNGAMSAPVSAGWNYVSASPYNPLPVTAFIQPPTFGPRNTPLNSINIQFSHAVPGLALANLSFENLTSAGLTLNTSDGGLNWTVGNLGVQQLADDDYAVKLFALGSGLTSSGAVLIGSTGIKWTLDTAAPLATDAAFAYLTSHQLRLVFNEDVSASLTAGDIQLLNLTNATTIPTGAMALAYDTATNTATITFPGLFNGILPDGDYRATLSRTQVTDAASNLLSADVSLDFFVLAGDADHDRDVDVNDLGILATNWQQSPRTFAQGDFDYTGTVDVNDLGILASHWQQQLAAPSAPFAPSARKAGALKRVATEVL